MLHFGLRGCIPDFRDDNEPKDEECERRVGEPPESPLRLKPRFVNLASAVEVSGADAHSAGFTWDRTHLGHDASGTGRIWDRATWGKAHMGQQMRMTLAVSALMLALTGSAEASNKFTGGSSRSSSKSPTVLWPA